MSWLKFNLPIRTEQQRIPWSWVLMMSMPVCMSAYVEKCSGNAMTFTMKKFISDPSLIMLLGSINIAFGVLVAPWIAWKSDNIFTPIGRRKPFIISGLIVLAACLVAMPLADSLWMLIPIILLFQFSVDFGYTGPWTPLYFDVVPDSQRGRGMIFSRYMSFAARLVFMYFLIGKFDEHVGMGRMKKVVQKLSGTVAFNLTGEQLIYFIGAALVLVTIVFVVFGIKETAPAMKAENVIRPKPSLKRFFSDLFGTPSKRLLCLPVIASVLMAAKLASLKPLLITEQFGYTKQIMGNINSISMLVNAALVLPLLLLLVDRNCRLKIFMLCMVVSTLQPMAFWSYVKFFAPDGIPSPATIIVFHIIDAAFDHAGMVVLWPMVFARTSDSDRGATSAAFLVVSGIVAFVSSNLLGLWVKGYSAMTCPEGTYDYMSGYLYIFGIGVIACVATFYYARRHRYFTEKLDLSSSIKP